jgi:hypothetical protein
MVCEDPIERRDVLLSSSYRSCPGDGEAKGDHGYVDIDTVIEPSSATIRRRRCVEQARYPMMVNPARVAHEK